MTSKNLFRHAVDQMLAAGLFSGHDSLAAELGMAPNELKAALAKGSTSQFSDRVKLKILALSGIHDIKDAIRIVETESPFEVKACAFVDAKTGMVQWLQALESFKRAAGIIEDKELAANLAIPTSTLSDIRRSKVDMSDRLKLLMLDHIGFRSIETAISFLRKDESAAALKRTQMRQARKVASQVSASV